MTVFHLKPFSCKLNFSNKLSGVTSFGGLALVRDVIRDLKLTHEMKWFALKEFGYDDAVILEAVLLLLVSGGRHLSDWEYLKADPGFKRIFPVDLSVDTIERYLKRLVLVELPGVSTGRGQVGYSYLLERLHERLIRRAYVLAGSPTELTLDLDATLIASAKENALFCYDHYKAYQPIIAYCPELGLVLSHEFRDGNIPASLGAKRLIERATRLFPKVKWTIRSDAAAYEHDLMQFLTKEKMRFFITADQSPEMQDHIQLMHASPEWQAYVDKHGIKTGEEFLFLNHAPHFGNQMELMFRVNRYNYILIRKQIRGTELFSGPQYACSVFVTNDLTLCGSKHIRTHRDRAGSVEYAHSQIKGQCGLDVLPSNQFSVNAAYFSLGLLTHNLIRYMQHHVLDARYKNLEIQTIRFRLIRAVAKIIRKARSIIIHYLPAHPLGLLHQAAQQRLAAYSP